ncbi:MAG: biotin-dependent carboxyltransferase family protein [Crocinitomicaceae bacterium]|nr:biotin-dependent carboxyltransferase family protein [Crocinitomicaceae bacterium]
MIEVIQPGLFTSLQDLGRFGYRHLGVPVSGAMDLDAAQHANHILGNDPTCAVLEITLQGPTLKFLIDTKITLTGAHLSPEVNQQPVEMYQPVEIYKDDELTFGKRISGVRSYLAVTGGFKTDMIFNSKSFYKGITSQEKLVEGDILELASTSGKKAAELQVEPPAYNTHELYVTPGPEFELLHPQQKEKLLSEKWTLGMNSRMAYQIEELMPNRLPSILSSAVLPGTIQLTPSGKMILLMRDCQTMGGYPRILQLTEKSINLLAQKMRFEEVSFRLIH